MTYVPGAGLSPTARVSVCAVFLAVILEVSVEVSNWLGVSLDVF